MSAGNFIGLLYARRSQFTRGCSFAVVVVGTMKMFEISYVILAFLAAFWCLQIPKQKLPNRPISGWPTDELFIFESTCLPYGRSLGI